MQKNGGQLSGIFKLKFITSKVMRKAEKSKAENKSFLHFSETIALLMWPLASRTARLALKFT